MVLIHGVLISGLIAPGLRPSAGDASTALKQSDLDRTVFGDWIAGHEGGQNSEVSARSPDQVIWTANSQPEMREMGFGKSLEPGVRHLRVGFRKPIAVGSVLVAGADDSACLSRTLHIQVIWAARKIGSRPNASRAIRCPARKLDATNFRYGFCRHEPSRAPFGLRTSQTLRTPSTKGGSAAPRSERTDCQSRSAGAGRCKFLRRSSWKNQ